MKISTYYTQQSELTRPGDYAHLLADLPGEIPALCRIVQGLILHYFNEAANEDRYDERNLRYIEKMLARMVELDDSPLTVARPPQKRLIGCCRDFATLFCAMARHQGIPSRVRVGFAAYFNPDFYHDHVVAECWDAGEQRWHLVDPVLEDRHIAKYRTQFNQYDVPRDQFIVGGLAWQMCRLGQADPDTFGFKPETRFKGWWFMRDKLVQDLAALNKRELLLWDYWGMSLRDLMDEDRALLDRVANITQTDNAHFDDMQQLYNGEADLRVPLIVESYRNDEPFKVRLALTENAV